MDERSVINKRYYGDAVDSRDGSSGDGNGGEVWDRGMASIQDTTGGA